MQGALGADVDACERLLPVHADVLVEVGVLLVSDVRRCAVPDGLGPVDLVIADLDGMRHEVRVLPNDGAELVIFSELLGVVSELQRDRCPRVVREPSEMV